uniref:C-C motif chemokine 5 isoform X1 n=1 Tax=Nyctereutes procyonoides TaxID=34880 RepID=UPI0024446DDA|nr:C-C motif chemokine 5 isoform X1 [Nyctereutes procyonoides]
MKVSAATFAVLLATATFCAPASASPYASDTTPCCFAYISGRLPFTHIQEYFYTSSKCSMPAVVFVTRKHRQLGRPSPTPTPTLSWEGTDATTQ